jgi:hypothetical protein
MGGACGSVFSEIMNKLCKHGRLTTAYCEPCALKKANEMYEEGVLETATNVANVSTCTGNSINKSDCMLHDDCRCDPVSSPPHYTVGGYEAIDVIKAKLTPKEYTGYLKGNILKYVMRANYKGHHDQDIEKSQWYVNELDNHLKSVNSAEAED